MNNKMLIGIIIVLLIVIGIVASKGTEDDSALEMEDEQAALADEVNGVVASATVADMTGVWRSGEDSKYILEFASDGSLREYYAQQLTGTGTWSVNAGVLTTSINGSSRDYDIISLSDSGFSAKYQTSDVVLEFSAVAGY